MRTIQQIPLNFWSVEKSILATLFALVFVSCLALPAISFADIIENFDSYTAGSSLSGNAGGSGWSGSWVVNPTPATAENAPSGMSGRAALIGWTSGDGATATRTFTPISVGIVSFKMQAAQTNKYGIMCLGDSAVPISRLCVQFAGDGLIYASSNAGVNVLQSYNASTTYGINVKFGHTTGNYAVSIDGGPFSADFPCAGPGSTCNSNELFFTNQNITASDFYYDDIIISATSTPPVPTPITGSGTMNRLAKFTGATTIGDALLSDDGTNTTLTSGNFLLQIGSIIDMFVSGVLNIGTTVANAITIGRVGITTTVPGILSIGSLTTTSNCNSTASPAVCGSAPAGSVALANGGTTLVVNTTAVTANSQIFVMEDSSLATRLGITCNTGTGRNYVINARTPGTSFTIKSSNAPVLNKACLSYWIAN